MKGYNKKQKPKDSFETKRLSLEDKNRLVDVFMWLINEDKKQNPELYKINNTTK